MTTMPIHKYRAFTPIDLPDRQWPGQIITKAPALKSKKALTILFVGRLHKRKGFQTLLEAFILLKSDYPAYPLIVL